MLGRLLALALLAALALPGLVQAQEDEEGPERSEAIVIRQVDEERTDFDLCSVAYSPTLCEQRLTIYDSAGRRLRTTKAEFNDFLAPAYKWSCAKTGRFAWGLTASGNFDSSDSFDTTEYFDFGTFTLKRCGKARPRAVRRGTAARFATERWTEDEFVSSSRCIPLRGTNRAASQWRCRVVHNDNLRECASTVVVRYTRQNRFGKPRNLEASRVTGTRCSRF